ncbi:MAG: alpha/beta fold hydrolase [Thermomicrobiales bacterium]
MTALPAPSSVAAPLSRRAALQLGASGLAATAALHAPGATTAQDTAPGSQATFVLVHGAWAGSWIWSKVIPYLRAAGHEVHAVTLTGLGDRAHLASPEITLDTHIADVVNTILYADLHNVSLVGHSYSGMVVTGVAEAIPERLAQVIYLDADVPTNGQNGWQAELYPDEGILADMMSGNAAGLPGFFTSDPYVEWIESMTSPEDAAWLLSKVAPQSLATYIQPLKVGNEAAAALPRAFICCTEDALESSTKTAERVRSVPNWRVIELANNHLVNVNDPQGTAEALMSLL